MSEFDNKIIASDCVAFLDSVADDTFDMCITSPPYDKLRNYNGFALAFPELAMQLFRTLKPGRVMVWVVNDATVDGSETGTSFSQALRFIEVGFNLHDTMIFKKANPIPQIYRKRYNAEFEYMFVLSKGPVEIHHPIRVPCQHAGLALGSTTYKNFSRNAQQRKKPANPVKQDKIKGNIWEYVVGKKAIDQSAKGHPAPFPVDLARDHIESWSNAGDLVLDPMCGSGSACLAAALAGRRYVGVDISADYCALASQRIAAHGTPDKPGIANVSE